jgi:hypothetical protein
MQLEVEVFKLYDSMVFNLELIIKNVLRVVFLASYIQGWRQSIWEFGFFQEFKTRDGIQRSKS